MSTATTYRLSPRRHRNLVQFLEFVASRGGKVVLDEQTYLIIERSRNVDRSGVNGAVDDAYALNAVDVRLIRESTQVVELMEVA